MDMTVLHRDFALSLSLPPVEHMTMECGIVIIKVKVVVNRVDPVPVTVDMKNKDLKWTRYPVGNGCS